jgi:hypothetical protein
MTITSAIKSWVNILRPMMDGSMEVEHPICEIVDEDEELYSIIPVRRSEVSNKPGWYVEKTIRGGFYPTCEGHVFYFKDNPGTRWIGPLHCKDCAETFYIAGGDTGDIFIQHHGSEEEKQRIGWSGCWQ